MSEPALRLENQVCFALYSASNAVTRAYRPLLEPLGLTYLQYMVMLLLWEHRSLNVKELGERLHLDSGTLTPLLKRLEGKQLVERRRGDSDERVRQISLTAEGAKLEEQAADVPAQLSCKLDLQRDQALEMKRLCELVLARQEAD